MLIVIIRPIGYRPRKGARVLYREPAYLICSDTQLSLEQLVQAYLWRWEIEVNIRDEKTVMGVGEAQVRTSAAVNGAPAFVVASYAFLLLAAHSIKATSNCLPSPKWYPLKSADRCSTQKILSLFRSQYWGLCIESNKSGVASMLPETRTHFYSSDLLCSALCYAIK